MNRLETRKQVKWEDIPSMLEEMKAQGAYKIDIIKNADNLSWDINFFVIQDQRDLGFTG